MLTLASNLSAGWSADSLPALSLRRVWGGVTRLLGRGLLAAALVACAGAQAESVAGKVVGVSDGDTVTVLDAQKRTHKIRLTGIDSPEKKQAFGERAKQSLSDMVFSKEVVVQVSKKDRYGRSLGRIEFGGKDINLEQIRRGMAWHYKAYERDQPPEERQVYAAAEQLARMQKVGLWSEPKPVPPWDFRKDK